MKLEVFFVILVLAIGSYGLADDQMGQWQCQAQGQASNSEAWQTVLAQGDSEDDATVAANQACFNQGLQYCNVTTCSQEP